MNGNCTDNIGSYDCRCNTGYMGDGFYCEDIDECNETNPIHNCDINADCTNTDGSFNCTCHFGYTGDGVSCGKCVCSKFQGNVHASTEQDGSRGRVLDND